MHIYTKGLNDTKDFKYLYPETISPSLQSIINHKLQTGFLSVISHSIMCQLTYSFFNAFTGLASAAFIAWKLTVVRAINKAAKPTVINTHQCMAVRYS